MAFGTMATMTGSWNYGQFLDTSRALTSELGLGAGQLAAESLKEVFQGYMKQIMSLYSKISNIKDASNLSVNDLKDLYGALMSIRELILQGQEIKYNIVMPNSDGGTSVSVVSLNTKDFLDYQNIVKSGNSLKMLDLTSARYIEKQGGIQRANEIRSNYKKLINSSVDRSTSQKMNNLLREIEAANILKRERTKSKRQSSLSTINEENVRTILGLDDKAELSRQYYTKSGNKRRFNRGWVFQAAMQAIEEDSGVSGFVRSLQYDTTPGFKSGDIISSSGQHWQIKGSNASIMNLSTMRTYLKSFLKEMEFLQNNVQKLGQIASDQVKQRTTELFTTQEGVINNAISNVVNKVVEENLLDGLDFNSLNLGQ